MRIRRMQRSVALAILALMLFGLGALVGPKKRPITRRNRSPKRSKK